MGSSMYAMGFWSRSSTPCRCGFGPASAAAPAGGSAGPSERVGLNTLRVATTVYAEAGARGDSGVGAAAGCAGGRARTCRAGAGAISSHTMKAAQASDAPPSTTFRSSSRRGTSGLGFGREDESRQGERREQFLRLGDVHHADPEVLHGQELRRLVELSEEIHELAALSRHADLHGDHDHVSAAR